MSITFDEFGPVQQFFQRIQRFAFAAAARVLERAHVEITSLAEGDFRAFVREDPEISSHLSGAEIEDAFDVRHALVHVAGVIDRGLQNP